MTKGIDKKLAKEQGQRLIELRKTTRLSRRAFAIKHQIPEGTLRNWEEGRYQGLTQKGIDQLLTAYRQEGIEVTTEWLLYGKGLPPRPISRIALVVPTAPEPQMPSESGLLSKTDIIKRTKDNAEQHKINKQLYEAALAGNYAKVVNLIKLGANLHLLAGINIHLHDNHENTPLHIAARDGYLEIVKFLLEKGSKVDVRNRRKQTPLHLACHNGHIDIVDYLVSMGANVDAVEDEGGTPLSWAAYTGQLDTAKRLIDYGANVHSADMDSNTPLHWACYHGHTEMVQFLLESGADFNRKNSRGLISLAIAIENGHLETVLFLVDYSKQSIPNAIL